MQFLVHHDLKKSRHFCRVGSPWFGQSKESNFLKSGIVPKGKIFETQATAVVAKEVTESYKSCASMLGLENLLAS